MSVSFSASFWSIGKLKNFKFLFSKDLFNPILRPYLHTRKALPSDMAIEEPFAPENGHCLRKLTLSEIVCIMYAKYAWLYLHWQVPQRVAGNWTKITETCCLH